MVKRSKIITQKPKTVENQSIIDIESITIKTFKNCHKLSKVIRQANKVSQVVGTDKNFTSPLYSETTNLEKNF